MSIALGLGARLNREVCAKLEITKFLRGAEIKESKCELWCRNKDERFDVAHARLIQRGINTPQA